MQPTPIARRPGLPSTVPSDTPIVVITAPPMARILFIIDIPNPSSRVVLADDADDGVHLSVQV